MSIARQPSPSIKSPEFIGESVLVQTADKVITLRHCARTQIEPRVYTCFQFLVGVTVEYYIGLFFPGEEIKLPEPLLDVAVMAVREQELFVFEAKTSRFILLYHIAVAFDCGKIHVVRKLKKVKVAQSVTQKENIVGALSVIRILEVVFLSVAVRTDKNSHNKTAFCVTYRAMVHILYQNAMEVLTVNNDVDKAARSMLNSPQGIKIIKALDKLNAISATESGYELIVMLAGSGSDVIKNAAKAASGVQKDRARAFLSTALSTKEGAALVAKIIEITGV